MATTPRVLLADTDAATRSALALLLRSKLGLSTIGEAVDGETLTRALADFQPDWLLLDWSLPGRPACEALLAARQAHPRLRLVVMSIDSVHAAAAEALDAVFIHKGSDAAQVLDRLRPLVEDRQEERHE
jgi:DNA-binding NarL/FixJ family response regulator